MSDVNRLRKTVVGLALLALCAAAPQGSRAQIAFRSGAQASVAAGTGISFVNSQTQAGTATSVTINRPAGVAANDVMIAQITLKGVVGTITAPAVSWNLIDLSSTSTAGSEVTQAVYWRRVVAGEPASYTWSWTGSRRFSAGIAAYADVDPAGSPIDASGVRTTNNSATITLPNITTTTANTMLVALLGSSRSSTHSTPTGMTTERYQRNTGGGTAGTTSSEDEQAQAAAGATGAKTATIGAGAADNIAHLLALRSSGTNLTIAVPAGTTTGDVMVAGITMRPCSNTSGAACTTTVTAPGGWTLVNGVDQTTGGGTGGYGLRLLVYQRVASAAEPASYTWTIGGAPVHAGADGGVASFSGVDNLSPIVASAGQTTPAATSHTAPSINTGAVTNTMLVSTHAANSSTAWTSPAGMTQAADAASLAIPDDLGVSLQMNYQASAAAGATGVRTATWTAPTPAADTGAAHLLALRPGSLINHLSVSHAGSGVACVDQTITITAHDAAHNAVSANSLAVNLSTTNARGTWTGIVSGGGTLSDPTPGDGAATYTFAAGASSVQLAFRYANLAASSETFGFNASGGGFSETTGTATGALDDPSFTMAQAGFQFRNLTDASTVVPTQISGKPSNTGWNAKTIRVQAVRTDTATGSCTGLFASQTRTLDLGAECNSPAACAGQQASVNGTSIATSNNNGGAGAAAYTGVSLAFNASSEADTVIAYPDAGQISVHARYDLDPGVVGFEMIGSSNAFVVRPFGLAFPGVTHGSTAASGILAAAGDNFPLTLTAYRWAAGEDADGNGVPDAGVNITNNGVAGNFSATATVTPTANLPGVALGAVSRGATCASAGSILLTAGTASAADWCYSEAGNVLLSATVTDYLGAADADVTGSSGNDGNAGNNGYVGRFKPKNFLVAGTPSRTNRTDIGACSASVFTYMNEALALGFVLEARNTQNGLTQNYTGAYAKLDLSTAASLGIGARNGTTNLSSRVDSSLAPSGSFSNGAASLTATTGINRIASPDTLDGPYAAVQFGIAPNDNDPNAATGVRIAASNFNLDVDNDSSNDHFAIGSTTQIRYGRLFVPNTYGTQSLNLSVPIETQYWSGSFWQRNADDSCSSFAGANMGLFNHQNMPPGNLDATHLPGGSVTMSSGRGVVVIAKPSGGATGSADLGIDLGTTATGQVCGTPATFAATSGANRAYLRANWCSGGTVADRDPVGRITFGVQPSRFIYNRENH